MSNWGVIRLLSLYSQAIDYYVSIQSDKYKYFKKKMTLLIIMPQVVESMEVAHQKNLIQQQKKKDEVAGCSQNSPAPKDFESKKIAEANNLMLTTPDYKKVDYLMRRQEFETNKNLNNITKSDRLKEIVNEHQLNSVKNTYLVQSNLKSQMENLNEKLLRRKRDVKPSLASSISGITIDHPSSLEIGEDGAEGTNRSSSIERQEGLGPAKLKRRSSQNALPQNPIDVFNALKNKIKDEK
jgi:hypothetical protein